MPVKKLNTILLTLLLVLSQSVWGQMKPAVQWTPDGNGIYQLSKSGIVKLDLKTGTETPLISREQLTTAKGEVIVPASFKYSNDIQKRHYNVEPDCLLTPRGSGAIIPAAITGYWISAVINYFNSGKESLRNHSCSQKYLLMEKRLRT